MGKYSGLMVSIPADMLEELIGYREKFYAVVQEVKNNVKPDVMYGLYPDRFEKITGISVREDDENAGKQNGD